ANGISSFRSVVRRQIDARVAMQPQAASQWSVPPAKAAGARWNWAWVPATIGVVLLVITPFLTNKIEPPRVVVDNASTLESPDDLMNAVNLHISRMVPAPMERMMVLMPMGEPTNESGGVQ